MQSVVLGRGKTWLNEENSRMPLGQLLDSKDAARLAVYLLSEVSAPMTGVALDLEQRITGAPV